MRTAIEALTLHLVATAEIDAALAEDGRTLVIYGHLPDTDVATLVASVELPVPVEPAAFLADEWGSWARRERHTLRWRLA